MEVKGNEMTFINDLQNKSLMQFAEQDYNKYWKFWLHVDCTYVPHYPLYTVYSILLFLLQSDMVYH